MCGAGCMDQSVCSTTLEEIKHSIDELKTLLKHHIDSGK